METRSLWKDLEAESWTRRRRDYCGCGSDYMRRGHSYNTVIVDRSSMAPGTSSMLRARRRDVNAKPNRVLDRNSSRGMIYENEELRLRTININAEVEKGQHDIKKLRRENDQLRREIWNLRDEYDRLEAILKSKNISTDSEEEETEEEVEGEEGCDGEGEAPTAGEVTEERTKDTDKLSVVEEESEWSDATEDKPKTVSFREDALRVPGRPRGAGAEPSTWPDASYIPGPQIFVPSVPAMPSTPVTLLSRLPTMGFSPVTSLSATPPSPLPMQQGTPATSYFPGLDSNLQTLLDSVNVGRECAEPALTPGGSEVVTTAILQRRQSFARTGDQTKDTFTCTTSQHTNGGATRAEPPDPPDDQGTPGQCETYSGTAPSFLRFNSVQPFTLVFSVTDPQLANLSVQEVIDSMSEQLSASLMHSLRGVRLVGGNCYLSFSSQQDADAVLTLPLRLRGCPLTPEDASVGATVIALTGVPHDVDDDSVAEVLAHFGSLVGPVERRVYKGVDTGERLVRLRARLAIPRWIWLEGCRVSLKILRSEELSGLSLARRKSFRSHISVQLQPVTDDTPPVPPLPQTSPPIPPLPASSNSTTPFFTTPPRTSLASTNPFMCGSVPSIPAVPNTTESLTSGLTNASASTPNIFHESPFFFPTSLPTNESPGLRRINSVMGTMSLGGVAPPEISHVRSASSPPTTTAQLKSQGTIDSETAGQTSIPPSPNTARKTAQRHKPTRKISKISIDSRKANGECSQTSSSDQDSPQKGRRRPSSVNFKQKPSPSILNRTTSVDQTDGTGYEPTTCSERERSNSDLSSRLSICKRKLSTTGRESGKVPWCGCWGNGCL